MLPPSLRETFRRDMLVRRSGSRFELNSSKLFYLFIWRELQSVLHQSVYHGIFTVLIVSLNRVTGLFVAML